MSRSRLLTPRRLLLASVALMGAAMALALATHGTIAGLAADGAYLLPPSLLIVLLLVRGYPGERALLSAIRRALPTRRRRPGAQKPLPRPRVLIARGGRLIASSLAVRPPPPHAAAAVS